MATVRYFIAFLGLFISLLVTPVQAGSSDPYAAIENCFLRIRRSLGFRSSNLWSARSRFGLGKSLHHRNHKGGRDIFEAGRPLRVMEYNLLNLELTVGKYVEDPLTGKVNQLKGKKLKRQDHHLEQAQIILRNNPDIAVLVEVEDPRALQRFVEREEFLNRKYLPFILEGNDSRGIHIAMLVRRDLKLDIRYYSFKDLMGNYREKQRKIFSRDFPILELRSITDTDTSPPRLVIAGTHYKSMRDSRGDKNSNRLRGLQVKASLDVLKRVEKYYGKKVPTIIAGDFNNTIGGEGVANEFSSFMEAGFKDSFDVSRKNNFGSSNSRITHTYHPRNGPTAAKQIDSILINPEFFAQRGRVEKAGIIRYFNSDGTEKAIPDTYEQRQDQPSDHFPIWADLVLP